MPLLNLSEKEKQLDKQFREFHKNCSLEDCNELRDYYTDVKGLWRKITGKPRYKIKPGPYPSHFSYIISNGAGIGEGIDVKCNYCGESLDITDYDCW